MTSDKYMNNMNQNFKENLIQFGMITLMMLFGFVRRGLFGIVKDLIIPVEGIAFGFVRRGLFGIVKDLIVPVEGIAFWFPDIRLLDHRSVVSPKCIAIRSFNNKEFREKAL